MVQEWRRVTHEAPFSSREQESTWTVSNTFFKNLSVPKGTGQSCRQKILQSEGREGPRTNKFFLEEDQLGERRRTGFSLAEMNAATSGRTQERMKRLKNLRMDRSIIKNERSVVEYSHENRFRKTEINSIAEQRGDLFRGRRPQKKNRARGLLKPTSLGL